MPKLVLATHNAHKLQEVKSILAPLGITVLGGDEVGLTDPPETGTTFAENALIKARAAYRQVHLPVLADDSGLCITALNDAPGLYSARFAAENGGYPAVFSEIERRIHGNPDRSAHFICCLALIINDTEFHTFIGRMDGHIADSARGTHLFGYDPIFIPDGQTQTCGELDPAIKNKISHRARALKQLTDFLKEHPDKI